MTYVGKHDPTPEKASGKTLKGSAEIKRQDWSEMASVPDENGDLISLFQHNRRAVRTLFEDGTVNLVVFPKGSGSVPEENYHPLARQVARRAYFEHKEVFHA